MDSYSGIDYQTKLPNAERHVINYKIGLVTDSSSDEQVQLSQQAAGVKEQPKDMLGSADVPLEGQGRTYHLEKKMCATMLDTAESPQEKTEDDKVAERNLKNTVGGREVDGVIDKMEKLEVHDEDEEQTVAALQMMSLKEKVKPDDLSSSSSSETDLGNYDADVEDGDGEQELVSKGLSEDEHPDLNARAPPGLATKLTEASHWQTTSPNIRYYGEDALPYKYLRPNNTREPVENDDNTGLYHMNPGGNVQSCGRYGDNLYVKESQDLAWGNSLSYGQSVLPPVNGNAQAASGVRGKRKKAATNTASPSMSAAHTGNSPHQSTLTDNSYMNVTQYGNYPNLGSVETNSPASSYSVPSPENILSPQSVILEPNNQASFCPNLDIFDGSGEQLNAQSVPSPTDSSSQHSPKWVAISPGMPSKGLDHQRKGQASIPPSPLSAAESYGSPCVELDSSTQGPPIPCAVADATCSGEIPAQSTQAYIPTTLSTAVDAQAPPISSVTGDNLDFVMKVVEGMEMKEELKQLHQVLTVPPVQPDPIPTRTSPNRPPTTKYVPIVPKPAHPVTSTPCVSYHGLNGVQSTIQQPVISRHLQPVPIAPALSAGPVMRSDLAGASTMSPLSIGTSPAPLNTSPTRYSFAPAQQIPTNAIGAGNPYQQPSWGRTEDVEANRKVARIPTDRLLHKDQDGDSLLMLFVVKEMGLPIITALLARSRREGILDKIVNECNNLQQSPVYMATVLNQPHVVQKLVEFGADVNLQAHMRQSSARGPLHFVASKGDVYLRTLRALLASPNVSINQSNFEGHSPLHCAILAHKSLPPNRSGEIIFSKQIIEELVLHGANVNQGDGKSGKTPIHYAVESKDTNLVEHVFNLVRSHNAYNTLVRYVNTTTFDGNTSLHLAVGLHMPHNIEEHKTLVSLLMRSGADPTLRNISQKMPKDLAKNTEIQAIVKGTTACTRK